MGGAPPADVKVNHTVFGNALYRDSMIRSMIAEVAQWLTRCPRLAVYGKRAWNAWMKDERFRRETTDVDVLFVGVEVGEFWEESTKFISHMVELGKMYGPVTCFAHDHHDRRGVTVTFGVCGINLVDLTYRNERPPSEDVHTLDLLPRIPVRMVGLKTLFQKLRAEIADVSNWRRTLAGRELRYYRLCADWNVFEQVVQRRGRDKPRSPKAEASKPRPRIRLEACVSGVALSVPETAREDERKVRDSGTMTTETEVASIGTMTTEDVHDVLRRTLAEVKVTLREIKTRGDGKWAKRVEQLTLRTFQALDELASSETCIRVRAELSEFL